MTVKHVPVLIAGAGAAGLTTSALLAKHRVRSLLIEKRSEVFIYPKARNLSFRSLEILRGLGLADEVHAIAQGVSDMLSKPTLNSAEEHQAFDISAIFSPFKELSPEPAGQYCPQSAFEPILLAHIRRQGSQVRYNTELGSFEQDARGVTAVVCDRKSGATEAIRADYLVAADGVHSPIRDSLGVTTFRLWGAADLCRLHLLPGILAKVRPTPRRRRRHPSQEPRRGGHLSACTR